MKEQSKVFNIGFVNSFGEEDETQFNVPITDESTEIADLISMCLYMKDEMDMKEIIYVDYVGIEEVED